MKRPNLRRDLHELSRDVGAPRVADVIRVSERALTDIRRGYHVLTVDHLYLLSRGFPDFDLDRTVNYLGKLRAVSGRARARAARGRK